MMGLPLLAVYLLGSWFIVRCMLPKQSPLVRAWLGTALGIFLMMWLPALLAFLRPFDALTQYLSLLPLLALCALAFWMRKKAQPASWDKKDKAALRLLLVLALPMTVLAAWLLHTHILMPRGGALYTGQATYGDLPLHLSIITSIPGNTLPMDYSILPGVRLGYPFLANSLSSSFLVLGLNLRWSILVPSLLMMALVFSGYILIAHSFCASNKSAALATLLVFINGGLGFLYSLDMLGVSMGSPGSNELQLGQWGQRLSTILNGWYQTPPNHAEFSTYNLRWSNLIADMLLPQRTFLAGWCILLPCLYLLLDQAKNNQWQGRNIVLLGVLAGGLPLIHTHSFLALGLFSLGLMLYGLLRKQGIKPWLLYAALACALALPQLLAFTFGQSGAKGFVRFQFNWVNNTAGRGLQDGYLWFYIKNIGLPFVLLIFALFEKNIWHRQLFAGAFTVFLAAELILFQPNEYDNNKLFYVWWAVCAMPVADYMSQLWHRLQGLKARRLMGALAAILLFSSGALSLAREAVSSYQMFSASDVALANFLRDETPPGSRFVSGTQHINPVSSLAGRQIVCGPSLWLYYHGLDIRARQADLDGFFRDPNAHKDLPAKYGAGYVVLGPHERIHSAKPEAFSALYELVYDQDNYQVFKVPGG